MSKMEIHEIEAHIEMATERLQELAEKLNDLEYRGYDEEDAEYMDVAIEARLLMGYKSELVAALKQREELAQGRVLTFGQENPADSSPSNPPFDSNPPEKAIANTLTNAKN